MLNKKFSGHKRISGGTKKYWVGTAPECPPWLRACLQVNVFIFLSFPAHWSKFVSTAGKRKPFQTNLILEKKLSRSGFVRVSGDKADILVEFISCLLRIDGTFANSIKRWAQAVAPLFPVAALAADWNFRNLACFVFGYVLFGLELQRFLFVTTAEAWGC